ncbi:hypothetical protein RFI_14863 [Reticulomyxa filosa]|uniref:Uncharacterized protein n=1 Tax=Reticulomyxa filosa TaxID=46433 RepID=X6NAK2_RETFI|nr:hypothetical protein RFI_14863 [Reticulomyxa filosa]|eukprot:ETO22337.1 hypothetical protein RFI_14863 [Reticulomyxa filosa]
MHLPVAFLSRFEKFYLDPATLEYFLDPELKEKQQTSPHNLDSRFEEKYQTLSQVAKKRFSDHPNTSPSQLFIGFVEKYTFISLVANFKSGKNKSEEMKNESENKSDVENAVEGCFQLLLKNTALEFVIHDANKQREFLPYADIVDVLEREAANEKNNFAFVKIVTHDNLLLCTKNIERNGCEYQLTVEHASTTFLETKKIQDVRISQISQVQNVTIIGIKDIRDFTHEIDLFTYVTEFFRMRITQVGHLVLVLACDPPMEGETLTHYLHAQYIVEKAYHNYLRTNEVLLQIKKTVVMLFYRYFFFFSPFLFAYVYVCVYRDGPQTQIPPEVGHPLIVSGIWKHVFVDALLPADVPQEIQISDVNIFDKESCQRIHNRIKTVIFDLVKNCIELALNRIQFSEPSQDEASNILRTYLQKSPPDNGRFREILNQRILDVLSDERHGTTKCLQDLLEKSIRNVLLDERGSLRSQFLTLLREKIKSILVEVLTVIFDNQNLHLYNPSEPSAESRNELFLKALNEPKITRTSQPSQDTQILIRNDIPNGGQFPFSSYIHSWISSYQKETFNEIETKTENENKAKSLLSSEVSLTQHVLTTIQTNGLKVLEDLPIDLMRKYIQDVIHLQARALGLNSYESNMYALLHRQVCSFVEKACEKLAEESNIEDQDHASQQDSHLAALMMFYQLNADPTQMHIDTSELSTEQINAASSFQIAEVYSILWTHEPIFQNFIKIVFVLKERPQEIENLQNAWEESPALFSSIQKILTIILKHAQNNLYSSSGVALQDQIEYLVSLTNPFEEFLSWLAKYDESEVMKLKKQWELLLLQVLCIRAANLKVDSNILSKISVRFEYRGFDDFDSLNEVLENVSALIGTSQFKKEKESALQWVVQNYLRTFVFKDRTATLSDDFVENLVLLLADGKSKKLCVEPTIFTKMEIATNLLSLLQNNNQKNLGNYLQQHLNDCDLNSEFPVLILRAHEQFLHFKEENRQLSLPSIVTRLVAANANLKSSLEDKLMLDQLLAIGECKFCTYHFAHYLKACTEFPSYFYGPDGITHFDIKEGRKITNTYLGASDCAKIGAMYVITPNMGAHEQKVRRGLQFYLLTEFWNNTIVDDVFRVLEHSATSLKSYEQTQLILKDAKKNRKIVWNEFNQSQFVHLVAGVLNVFYKAKNTNFEVMSRFMPQVLQTIRSTCGQETDRDYLGAPERVNYLLCQLAVADSDLVNFKNQKQDVFKKFLNILNLGWHLVGVILSLPPSPLSILFHAPKKYRNGYLLGMPEDQSVCLLKARTGHQAWMCPQKHLFFAADGSSQSLCSLCNSGNSNNNNNNNNNVKTTKRVDENGHIVRKVVGGSEVKYDTDMLTPRGYVIIEGEDDICRDFDETSVRIARLFVNLLLLIHHSCMQRSQVVEFTKLSSDAKNITNRLLKLITTYIEKIAHAVDHLSEESCVLLLHRIIQQIYETYVDEFPNGLEDLSIRGRQEFEVYLISKCIDPVLLNHGKYIRETREWTLTDPNCVYWTTRIDDRLSLEKDEGKEFLSQYYPHIYLPFQEVTLLQFRSYVMQDKNNNTAYPVISGLLKTMALSSGYSVFALRYLPEMINWMKLVHYRFNGRLTREEAGSKTAQDVLNRCIEDKWGDINQWITALKGFSTGWNHVVSRTADSKKQGAAIDEKRPSAILDNFSLPFNKSHPIAAKSEEKKEKHSVEANYSGPRKRSLFDFFKKDETNTSTEDEKGGNEDNLEDMLDVTASENDVDDLGWMKRFLVLSNQPFQLLKTDANNVVSPQDVPLSLALECGPNSPLETSKMLRLLLDHLVTVNNSLLENCSKSQHVEKTAVTRISNEKDVVGINEEELSKMIQQCASQKSKYGQAVSLNINLELLETQIKEKYIVGRKYLSFDLSEITFELSGEYDMQEVFDLINQKFSETANQPNYFEKVDDNVLLTLNTKLLHPDSSIASYALRDNVNPSDYANLGTNSNKLKVYKTPKEAVEQVLLAIRRQKTVPTGTDSIGLYMKKILHLHQREYEPFEKTNELCLKHSKSVWEYLNRMYLMEESKWCQLPKGLLKIYQDPPSDETEQLLGRFVTDNETDAIWSLLLCWKKILETTLSRQALPKPNEIPLSKFLHGEIKDDDLKKLVLELPIQLQLNHAGIAFQKCASKFEKKIQASFL